MSVKIKTERDFDAVYQQFGTAVSTLNLFEECFIENKDDMWHYQREREIHISPLTVCGKKAAIEMICPVDHDISTRGIFYIGDQYLHKDTQEKYIKRFPFSIAEFPVGVLIHTNKDPYEDDPFYLVGKIDLADYANSRLIDIKSIASYALKWIKEGSSKNPSGAKKAHIKQALTYTHIWNNIIVKDPSSFYYLEDTAILYINKDNFEDVYCQIPVEVFDTEGIFNLIAQDAIGVHNALAHNDWTYLNKKCVFDPNDYVCSKYCSEAENCKKGLDPADNPVYQSIRSKIAYNGGELNRVPKQLGGV